MHLSKEKRKPRSPRCEGRRHVSKLYDLMCSFCGSVLSSLQTKVDHQRQHYDDGSSEGYRCATCKSPVPSVLQFGRHFNKEHSGRDFRCLYTGCETMLATKQVIISHHYQKHGPIHEAADHYLMIPKKEDIIGENSGKSSIGKSNNPPAMMVAKAKSLKNKKKRVNPAHDGETRATSKRARQKKINTSPRDIQCTTGVSVPVVESPGNDDTEKQVTGDKKKRNPRKKSCSLKSCVVKMPLVYTTAGPTPPDNHSHTHREKYSIGSNTREASSCGVQTEPVNIHIQTDQISIGTQTDVTGHADQSDPRMISGNQVGSSTGPSSMGRPEPFFSPSALSPLLFNSIPVSSSLAVNPSQPYQIITAFPSSLLYPGDTPDRMVIQGMLPQHSPQQQPTFCMLAPRMAAPPAAMVGGTGSSVANPPGVSVSDQQTGTAATLLQPSTSYPLPMDARGGAQEKEDEKNADDEGEGLDAVVEGDEKEVGGGVMDGCEYTMME